MSGAYLAAFVGFPFVAGLHRYAVSYGYRGVSRQRAWDEAVHVWKGAVAILVVLWLVHGLIFRSAEAHEFYAPSCCSGSDCGPALEGEIVEAPGGWRIVPSGEFLTYGDRRVHVAPDGKFHRCLAVPSNRTSHTYCIYVPENGS